MHHFSYFKRNLVLLRTLYKRIINFFYDNLFIFTLSTASLMLHPRIIIEEYNKNYFCNLPNCSLSHYVFSFYNLLASMLNSFSPILLLKTVLWITYLTNATLKCKISIIYVLLNIFGSNMSIITSNNDIIDVNISLQWNFGKFLKSWAFRINH